MEKNNMISQYETPECNVMKFSPEGVMCLSGLGGASNQEIGEDIYDNSIW